MKRFFRILVLLFAVIIGTSSAFVQRTYKVGDYYNDGTKEGVVFWVDDKGTSGEIISLDEAELQWSTNSSGVGIATTNHFCDGKVNTDKVMAHEMAYEHQAFVWCRNKGKDWYLPAIGEVLCFCIDSRINVINRSLATRGAKLLSTNSGDYYWSSTVDDESESLLRFVSAYCLPAYVDVYNSVESIRLISKSDKCKVRAVARFGNVSIAQVLEIEQKNNNTTATSTAVNKTYKVGDYYNDGSKEGVVFLVDATGKHGKIVSMQQTSASWSSYEAEQKCYIGALSKTDGKANMKVVMGRPNWKTNYPAFAWCANLGAGWYLPAIEELEKFTLNDAVRNAVNRTLEAKGGIKLSNKSSSQVMWYWSSTEREYQYSNREYSAQLVSMDAATIGRARKSVQGPVRAVATF